MKKIITKKVLTNDPEFPTLVKMASHTHFMNIFKLSRLLLHNKHDVFHCVCSRHYITQVQIAPTVALLYFEWTILLRISYQSCWFTSVGCDKNIIITGSYYHSRQGCRISIRRVRTDIELRHLKFVLHALTLDIVFVSTLDIIYLLYNFLPMFWCHWF